MKRLLDTVAILAAFALVAAACGGDDSGSETTQAPTQTTAAPTPTTSAPTPTTQPPTETTEPTEPAPTEVAIGRGVTEEPCPDDGPLFPSNPGRGCIYLGIITDETATFAAASPALVAAHRTFWSRVNAGAGIGDAYDVRLPDDFKVNNDYTPATHAAVYAEINEEVLALAESLGTSQSLAAIEEMKADSMVAAPATWWSGWAFKEQDGGLVLETGSNYCVEGMNSMDWATGAFAPQTVGVIWVPNDYGRDWDAGVRIGAEANNMEVVFSNPTIPVSLGGDAAQTEAVTAILQNSPDVTVIVTGPTEAAAIVGGAASQGHTKPIIGASPTWNPALLQTAAGPAFEAGIYFTSIPWGPWDSDTPGHAALRAAAEAVGIPPTNFFTAGWAWQYPLKAALEAAYAAGDLTPEGIVAAANSLTSVDYEGMLPEGAGNYAADGDGSVVRQSMIGAIDPTSADGVVVAQDFFAGPTVSAYTFEAPCAGA